MKEKQLRGMTDEDAANVFVAYKNGKIIQFYSVASRQWVDTDSPLFTGSTMYRIRPPEIKVPWEFINSRYNYFAVDQNGTQYLYQELPSANTLLNYWYSDKGDNHRCDHIFNVPTNILWSDTLIERPNQ